MLLMVFLFLLISALSIFSSKEKVNKVPSKQVEC